MNVKHAVVVALSVCGLLVAADASARQLSNNKTQLTFDQPVEIPGQILPAGTYTFQILDGATTDRHIVQIFDARGTKIVATVMAVPESRATVTGETLVKFHEVPAGAPAAIRVWYYPNERVGQAFVYPKARAEQLATASNVAVASMADSAMADLKKPKPDAATMPVITINPAPMNSQLTTTPQVAVERTPRRELPKTAGLTPLMALIGIAAIALGAYLGRGNRATSLR